METLLAMQNIHFCHKGAENELLKGVNLCLNQGERLALLGDNGSGKSTLLHIATGLLKPTEGEILFEGKPCREEKDFVQARKSIGYLLQHSEDQLFCPTVIEDVAFGPYNQGATLAHAKNMAEQTLEKLGIQHLAHKNGSLLSGGEQKLAALATLLVSPIKMLFLDEPTNDLDAQARALVTQTILESRLPCLVVSHDKDFQQQVCKKFLHLENGCIVKEY